MQANRNNFLRFSGSATSPDYLFAPPSSSAWSLYANQDSIIINPLSSVGASLGVNPKTFEIIEIKDSLGNDVEMSRECFWDGVSNLTVYRPVNISITLFFIRFTYKDYSGNVDTGNEAAVFVDPIIVGWVAYAPSASCSLDSFGNNTGYLEWALLKLINTGTMADILPLQLKPNIISDGDYVAPITDHITCPVVGAGSYAPLFIGNFSRNGADLGNYITITNIYLASTNLGPGSTPIALNIPCNIAPGQTQRFNVPSGAWDTGLTISYSVTGNMVAASPQRYWKKNTAGSITGWPTGGATTNPVDNSGIYGNFSLTVPPSSSGVTILAQ